MLLAGMALGECRHLLWPLCTACKKRPWQVAGDQRVAAGPQHALTR